MVTLYLDRLSYNLRYDGWIEMRRLTRSRRAISPVISTLLLILLAVAAGVVAYAYVMGWLGSATKSPKASYGELQFDSIYATSGTPGTIMIYVRNVGGIDLEISKIYVDGVQKDNATGTFPAACNVGDVIYLEVSVTMTKHKFYEVALTCTDGTSVSQAVKAR